MEEERYLKVIFQRGSVIFRKVKSYRMCSENQLLLVEFEDGGKTTMDMIYLHTALGRFDTIKDNIYRRTQTIIDINEAMN